MHTNIGKAVHEAMRAKGPRLQRSYARREVSVPFAALPDIEPARKDAIEAEALRLNSRYLLEFIEEYSFCPYARRGRELGQTWRYFYYADTADVAPLVALMHRIAADPAQIVAQVIMPLIDVDARAWRTFCSDLTEYANHDLPREDGIVTAALHPELPYSDDSAFTLIPLFRRAPDPTIQWVRRAALDGLYEGRGRGTSYIEPGEIPMLLTSRAPPRPLYDRIALTNEKMARRLRVPQVERMLAEIRDDGRRSYERVLLDPRYDHPQEAR